MEPNIYQKIFNRRYPGMIIDVEGIKVKLIDIVEDDNLTPPYTLNFEMVNPMGISYTEMALEILIGDELEHFNHMLGTPYYSRINIVNAKEIYLGDDLKGVFGEILGGIKQFKTDSYDDDGKELYTLINVEHLDFEVDFNKKGESVDLINKVRFLDAYEVNAKTNELDTPLTYEDATSIYNYYIHDVYTDPNYQEIEDLAPRTFIDRSFMLVEVFTEFVK